MADQQEPSGFFSSITPAVVATLLVAFVSVVGALLVAIYNAHAQRELEREQFESNLILKAIGTGDKKLSAGNLRFLIEGGLIRKESEKVSRIIQDTSLHIHFPVDKPNTQEGLSTSSYYASALVNSTFSGIVVDKKTLQPIKGAIIFINTNRSPRRPVETKTTDYYGRFTLHYPSRDYTIRYVRPGYFAGESFQYVAIKFKKPVILKMQRAAH